MPTLSSSDLTIGLAIVAAALVAHVVWPGMHLKNNRIDISDEPNSILI